MQGKTTFFVIMGRSGAGKNYLLDKLETKFSREGIDTFTSISITTRMPREGEKDGVDYWFLSKDDVREDELFEYEKVAGNIYGTPIAPIDAEVTEEKIIFAVLEVKGYLQFKKNIARTYGEKAEVHHIIKDTPADVIKGWLKEEGHSDEAIEKRMSRDTVLEDLQKNDLYSSAFSIIKHDAVSPEDEIFTRFINHKLPVVESSHSPVSCPSITN